MVIAVIVTTASIALVINSSKGTDKVYQGANSLDIAESGAETAMIKLLRDSNYTMSCTPKVFIKPVVKCRLIVE
jgi:hypothetical protein